MLFDIRNILFSNWEHLLQISCCLLPHSVIVLPLVIVLPQVRYSHLQKQTNKQKKTQNKTKQNKNFKMKVI